MSPFAILLPLVLLVLLAHNGLLAAAENVIDMAYDMMGGKVVVPAAPINVTVWPGDATLPAFVFPEMSSGEYGIADLQSKPDFGIGVSGGGLRATCLAMGWLRGLRKLKLLNKARYIGSASGGTIASAVISYSDPKNLDKLLATKHYVGPKRATLKAIKTLGKGSFLERVATMEPTFYQTFFENLLPGPDASVKDSSFARTISDIIFNDIGLGRMNSTVTSVGTKGAVHERIGRVAEGLGLEVYKTDSSKTPYPIFAGNLLDSTEDVFFYPMEFTPLYCGFPGNFSEFTKKGGMKGGGIFEPMGFNGAPVQPVQPVQPGQSAVISINSTFVQPLSGQVSVSGGIMAVELQDMLGASPGDIGTKSSMKAGQPVYNTFNFQDYNATLFPYGDGGYTDNVGLAALLRRKVKKILLFYAVADGTTDKNLWSSANSGLSLPFGRCFDCYKLQNVSASIMNAASKVFSNESEFDRMFDTYHANMDAGKVNVFRAKLDVVENKYMGVPGGWQVDLMLVMNARVDDWEKQLPDRTMVLLNTSRYDNLTKAKALVHPLQTTQLVDFPFIGITIFKYNRLAAGALSQMATWQVLQLEKQGNQISKFIDGA